MKPWFDALLDGRYLEDAVERLRARIRRPLVDRQMLTDYGDDLVAWTRRALRAWDLPIAPVPLHWALLDKRRELYRFTLIDKLLHAAVGALLAERSEPQLSPRLFSYRRGRSSWQALAELTTFLAEHRRSHSRPMDRGVFALRCDVKSYGESIPMSPSSAVWPLIFDCLPPRDERERELLVRLVRPTIVRADSGEASPLVGVPTGSPIVNSINNLYLGSVDRLFASTADFYARFGDDILVVCSSFERLRAVEEQLMAELSRLGLRLNDAKIQRVFWNGAARAHAQLRGAEYLDYLGCRVSFRGELTIPRAKLHVLMTELRRRLKSADRLMLGASEAERVRALASVVSTSFDITSTLALSHAPWLDRAVDSRAQLRHLDYVVALAVAERIAGRRGVKAFRRCGYRHLRRQGLPSLLSRKNRAGRRAKTH